MELLLTRNRKDSTSITTIGRLAIDGVDTCWTLEDVVRPAGQKVAGQTAIPAGRYQVIVNVSNRFKREMCLLLNVPMFEGVRIHGGNTAADTEGCIIVAANKISNDKVQGTQEAKITAAVKQAIAAGQKVWITIR